MGSKWKCDRDRLDTKFVLDESGCWLWRAAKDRHGYGVTYYQGRAQRAHRAVYEVWTGSTIGPLDLDHLCRVPACVNPEHLEPTTHAENLRRGTDPNRHKKAQTECRNGHPLEGWNLIVRPTGRSCRECGNAARRAYYRRTRKVAY